MSILGTKAPRSGPSQRGPDKTAIARTLFYSGLIAFFVYIFVVYTLGDRSRELEVAPATRDSSEVIDLVQQYLKTSTHRGFSDRGEPGNCWDVFEGQVFVARYVSSGLWQVNAWYGLLRYYWRVDDESMEVTQDKWQETTLPTFDC